MPYEEIYDALEAENPDACPFAIALGALKIWQIIG